MSKKIAVSVIIPTYNGKKIIKECIDSVLLSKYPFFEILVIENGSTDESYDYLQKVYLNNKKVKIIQSKQNLWFTGGCNLGVKYAKGDILIFLNSDCVVDTLWIDYLVQFMSIHPQYIVQPKILLYGKKNIIDNVGGRYNFLGLGKGIGHNEIDKGQYNQNKEFDYANGTAFAIRKKFFEELGGFDEWFKFHYEDIDLNLRARKKGGKSFLCSESIVYHKVSQTFKAYIPSEFLQFNIRKNRLMVIIKNFSGLEKFIRISILLSYYFILLIHDLVSFNKNKISITFKSIISCFNKKYHLLNQLKVIRTLFPNVPAITYNFELIKILSNCHSILDIGCGSSSPLKFISQKNSIGIDGNKKSLEESKKKGIHNKYYLMNIKDLSKRFKKKQFDCCMALDVIEHLKKKDGFNLIKEMESLASKKVIIFTPNGFMPQYDPKNHYQEHLSGWSTKEIKEMGFKVIGMFGLKSLKGEGYGLRFRPKLFWGIISEITQLYTRFNPQSATALLCIKEL